jgi:hypothetical protein
LKGKVPSFCELESAIREQDGDAIDDWISPGTAEAEDIFLLKLQRLAADRADDPAEIFGLDAP